LPSNAAHIIRHMTKFNRNLAKRCLHFGLRFIPAIGCAFLSKHCC
jgi:hypothetical protein